MKANPHITDALYEQIGEEMARKEFAAGAMARAVAESDGNKARAESLYVKLRFEELMRQLEQHEATNAIAKEQQRQHAIAKDFEQGIITCPKCGYHGLPAKKPRGYLPIGFILMFAYVVPGLLYFMYFNGYKGVCHKCGRTLISRINNGHRTIA